MSKSEQSAAELREWTQQACGAFADMVEIGNLDMAEEQASNAFEWDEQRRYLEYLQDA